MGLFDISAILLTACAVAGFVNYKWIKLPSSIGLLLLAMVLGLIGILLKKMGLISNYYVELFLTSVDFKNTIFHGMLSFFLFGGALQININDLKTAKIPIVVTATISTLLSTFIIGFIFYFFANKLGFSSITLLYAMLFGAILSPTDPIAVLSIVKKRKASKKIQTMIVGESLFNDGVAVVFFICVLGLINASGNTGIFAVTGLLFREIGGGLLFGAAIGFIAHQMLVRIDAYHEELLITLAVAVGGYALAEQLSFSAPLATVVAGIIIGNHKRSDAMSDRTRKYIDSFWEAINEILNAVLFFLIGLEMIVINASITVVILGTICIFIALAARFISVAIPLVLLRPFHVSKRGTAIILTWGGLRGALSIAMVLSLQLEAIKEIFLPCIYFVVIFSIAVQGLTLGKVLKSYNMELQKVR